MCDLKHAFEAINIYQIQYSQVDKLWGYFSVVTLAMCGFAIGGKIPSSSTHVEAIAIVLAYLVFCIGNHQALVAGQKQLEQFAAIARSCALKVELEVSSITPIPHDKVKKFHLSVIIAVSLGVLVITL
ncbi:MULTISPECIES: hypothetical protein [Pseudoalteromonas]|uniref:hypothetical protein n=1 Tax=Pseudoalteromonas TaxID=53246 RepID=UPI00026D027B|nr:MULTISPECIES: hypothetical protein [Pseudoalteromonas]MCO7200544.1 hypothetical protein [Pseudoalteromonas sp. OANN1]WPU31340.1 hypothetical protein SIO17_20170 [Pseudoalteromonas piscicida]